jgi:hypothetical protein
VYCPERPQPEADRLYINVILALANIGSKKPEFVGHTMPEMIKCFIDSLTYARWRETMGDKNSVYQNITRALRGFGRRAPDYVLPPLIKCLSSSDSFVRFYAAALIDEMGKKPLDIIPSLVKCLTAGDESLRNYAIYTLDKIGKSYPEQVIPFLIRGLRDPNNNVRQYAAYALGRFGEHDPEYVLESVPYLAETLSDDDITVRQRATETLGLIGAHDPEYVKEAIPALIERLLDPVGNVRWCAICALEKMGGAEKGLTYVSGAIPPLIECSMRDPHDHIRWRATYTLEKFGVDVKMYHQALNNIQIAQSLVTSIKDLGEECGDLERALKRALRAIKRLDYNKASKIAVEVAEGATKLREGVPKLALVATTRDSFYAGTWIKVNFNFTNTGTTRARNIRTNLSDFFEPQGVREISVLKAGESAEMAVGLYLKERGKTPLEIKVFYEDMHGNMHKIEETAWLNILMREEPEKMVGKGKEAVPEEVRIFDIH